MQELSHKVIDNTEAVHANRLVIGTSYQKRGHLVVSKDKLKQNDIFKSKLRKGTVKSRTTSRK